MEDVKGSVKAVPTRSMRDHKTTRRSSSRAKKLSAAMRVVDEETRRVIQQNRIDALEADNLFENLKADADGEGDDEDGDAADDMWDDYAMSGSDAETSNRLLQKHVGGKKSKKDGQTGQPGGPGNQRKTRSHGQDLSKNLLMQARMSSTNISKDNVGKKG